MHTVRCCKAGNTSLLVIAGEGGVQASDSVQTAVLAPYCLLSFGLCPTRHAGVCSDVIEMAIAQWWRVYAAAAAAAAALMHHCAALHHLPLLAGMGQHRHTAAVPLAAPRRAAARVCNHSELRTRRLLQHHSRRHSPDLRWLQHRRCIRLPGGSWAHDQARPCAEAPQGAHYCAQLCAPVQARQLGRGPGLQAGQL